MFYYINVSRVIVPFPDDYELRLARSKVKRAFADTRVPAQGVMLSEAQWQTWLRQVNARIVTQRERMQVDIDEHQKNSLAKAIEAIRADFGRKRRTYRAALLRNPPSVPLWGVVSAHPDTIQFASWSEKQARRRIPKQIWAGCVVTQQAPLELQFPDHSEVAAAIRFIPAGEARVRQVMHPRLVCTVENKLCGIEHYFGTNALGELPRCSQHLSTPRRDMVCLTEVVEGKRSLMWYCNECRHPSTIALPPLVGGEAVDFLPSCCLFQAQRCPALVPDKPAYRAHV